MPQSKDDLSRSLVAFDQNSTVIALVELSSATWLVGGIIPGINRDPLKKLVPDQAALLKLVYRWRAMKPETPARRSTASPSPLKPAAMAFGWHGGCARGALKHM